MDWTEKMEQKKKIRKMAYRMLWADFKDLVLGWKVILILLMYLGFFILPYINEPDDYNAAGMYYKRYCVLPEGTYESSGGMDGAGFRSVRDYLGCFRC